MDIKRMRGIAEAKKVKRPESSGDWKTDAQHFSTVVMKEVYPRLHKQNADMLAEIDKMISGATELFEAVDDAKVKESISILTRHRGTVEDTLARLLVLTSRLGDATGEAAQKYGI